MWIVLCDYVLVAMVRKRLGIEASMFTILQNLSVSAFNKIQLLQPLASTELQSLTGDSYNHLLLFNQ